MVTEIVDSKVDAYKLGVGYMSDSMPRVVEAYNGFTLECFTDGALSAKEKQLIALGIALSANNEVCTFYHVSEAKAKGASTKEIMEVCAVAAAVGAGHAMSQGVTRVEQALESKMPVS